MWNVLPKLGLIKMVFWLFSAMLLAVLIPQFHTDGDVSYRRMLEASFPATLVFGSFIYFLGKWGWKIFWHMPLLGKLLNRHVCPNLNGKWHSEVISNHDDGSGKRSIRTVSFTIKADFFGFDIRAESNDNYMNSCVVLSKIYKDCKTGKFCVMYMFEATVPVPDRSDDRIFDGAAKLEVIFDDNNNLFLDGVYWTNRAWQRKLNTAGRIKISKNNTLKT
jgi:hypothetical protein